MPAAAGDDLGAVCPACRKSALEMSTGGSLGPSAPSEQPRPSIARRFPPTTSFIVALNVLVYLAMVASGVSPLEPTIRQLVVWGADWGPLSLGSQPWRILTSNYVHIGIIHIALNMYCFWNLGSLAEQLLGGWTYFAAYTACGIAGSLSSLWWHPAVVGAGASGAIFGVAGLLIAVLHLGRLRIAKVALASTMKSLLLFAGYNLFFGAIRAGTDNSAHLGGLAAGLAIGAALAKSVTSPVEVRESWSRGVFAAVGLMLLGLFILLQHTVPH
jgi:rhomboid protease GluP